MKSRCVTRGFTLVELLAALAIFGMLMAAAFGSVQIAQQSWQSGVEQADDAHELRTSIQFIRRQFASLVPMSYRAGSQTLIAFDGSQNAVRFIAPAPEAAAGAGMMTFGLVLRERDERTDVLLEIAPFDPGAASWTREQIERRVFEFHGFHEARFSYLGAPRADGPVAWHDEWPMDAVRFPESVRLAAGGRDNPVDFHFRIPSERWR